MSVVKVMVERERPARTIAVGDRVAQDLTDNQLPPDIMIVDDRIMRREIPSITATADETVTVRNPPGTITDEAWHAVKAAVNNPQRTKITVEGEEDLLALVAVLEAPQGSLIFYGQPREGIVAVKATEEMKQKIVRIIGEMKRA
jgi:uncharacterized protein (UPF0218 family)